MRYLTVVLLALAPAPLAAQGWVSPRNCRCPSGRECALPTDIIVSCPVGGTAIVRTSSDVHVDLADRVLRYEVDETFVNQGGGLGEADYYFPLPPDAAFQDLKLSVNGEMVAGETMNADQARRVYETIVRQRRDPALVEWMGHGLLHARIFPILAGERKRVVVRFQAVALREGDAIRLDYHRGHGALLRDERGGRDGESSFTIAYPEQSAYGEPYSPTHTLRTRDSQGRRTVDVQGDNPDVTVLLPMRTSREPAISVLANAASRDEGFALITLSPPSSVVRATPRDITLVIDVSGSMSGEKIRQARAAGEQLLATLGPRDRFRLIDFSTDVRTFRDDFAAATPENLAAARRYLDALEANGSTNIAGALRAALAPADGEGQRLGLVLFITDGEPTVGEQNPDAIARIASSMRGDRRVFTFGLGADVNAGLLEDLALDGRGTAQFVRPDENVERAVQLVAQRLTNPVLTNVRVRVEGRGDPGVRLAKMMPADPADVFAGQDLVLFAQYSGSGPARIRFEGDTPNGPVNWSDTVTFPEHQLDNAFVPRLWAAQRLGWLSAEKRRHGASSEIDAEIRELGERYGIPTEFTSYLVQEPQATASLRRMPSDMASNFSGARGAAAPAPALERFEAAKMATAQRDAKSLASLDSLSGSAGGSAWPIKGAGSHLFVMRDSVWTDSRYSVQAGLPVVVVRPFTPGYFKLIAAIPDLREALALGERVRVVGRHIVIETGPNGVTELSDAQLTAAREQW